MLVKKKMFPDEPRDLERMRSRNWWQRRGWKSSWDWNLPSRRKGGAGRSRRQPWGACQPWGAYRTCPPNWWWSSVHKHPGKPWPASRVSSARRAISTFGFRSFVACTELLEDGVFGKVLSCKTDEATCIDKLEIGGPSAELRCSEK